jgi:hypothetical protein
VFAHALLSVCVTALAPPVAHGEADVLRLLRSDDPRLIAWGAYYVADRRIQSAESTLLSLPYIRAINSYILDALLQLHARPSPEIVERMYRDGNEFAAALFWLLDPATSDETFLRLIGDARTGDEVWVASSNMLAHRRSVAFVDWLLAHAKITLELTVATNTRIVGESDGIFDGGIACQVADPDGYPPRRFVTISTSPEEGTLLAGGSHPIYMRRTSRGSGLYERIDRNRRMFEYLAELARTPLSKLPVQNVMKKTIVFRSAAQLERSFLSWIADLRAGHLRLIRLLSLGSVAPSKEATPHFSLTVHDERDDETVLLPALAVPESD